MLPLVLAVEMEFVSEAVNISMGMPIQDVFIDAGNGQVVRPEVLNAETLALPDTKLRPRDRAVVSPDIRRCVLAIDKPHLGGASNEMQIVLRQGSARSLGPHGAWAATRRVCGPR